MNSIQNFVTESFILNEEQNIIDKEHQTAAKVNVTILSFFFKYDDIH